MGKVSKQPPWPRSGYLALPAGFHPFLEAHYAINSDLES